MIKKIFSALLCAAMTLNLLTVNISAEETFAQTVSENEGIIEALRMIEPVKENYGLTEADLENMEVADPIKTYEYTSEGISFLRNYFPLICNGALTAWAIEDTNGSKVLYQISTSYINEISRAINNMTSFALIYDKNSCYLFDGKKLQKLGTYENIESRIITDEESDFSAVKLNSICETSDLGYTHDAVAYGAVLPEVTYKCNVSYVTQNGYEYSTICWAATAACIVNCVKGTNYTAWDVFTKCSDLADSKTKGLDNKNATVVLGRYGLSYQHKKYVPTISVIENNIKNNYPINGFFQYFNYEGNIRGHACAIYGCTISNQDNALNCIYIMDPQVGFTTAYYSSSTYKYIAGSTGYEVWLYQAACRY